MRISVALCYLSPLCDLVPCYPVASVTKPKPKKATDQANHGLVTAQIRKRCQRATTISYDMVPLESVAIFLTYIKPQRRKILWSM